MRDGAYELIEKPYSAERLVKTVQRALEKRTLTLENRLLRQELDAHSTPGPRIIGRTPSMVHLRATIARIADTNADILVGSRTGTWQRTVARSLHEHIAGARKICAVNCGAVPESNIESELFGKKPFLYDQKDRIGKFEHASGGTQLLDE
jgi:two-component system C4-dicarboxylate transport response regulator DctD